MPQPRSTPHKFEEELSAFLTEMGYSKAGVEKIILRVKDYNNPLSPEEMYAAIKLARNDRHVLGLLRRLFPCTRKLEKMKGRYFCRLDFRRVIPGSEQHDKVALETPNGRAVEQVESEVASIVEEIRRCLYYQRLSNELTGE